MVPAPTGEAFIIRLNIAHYKELLAIEADSERRRVIGGCWPTPKSRLTELDGSAVGPEGSKLAP